MTEESKNSYLQTYEIYIPSASPLVESLFKIILFVTLSIFIGLGLILHKIEPDPEKIIERITRIRTQFLIEEKKAEIKKVEKKKPKKKKKPIDLSEKPKLNQKVDDIVKTQPKKKRVRRVYGLKKVYSKGIGSGGRLSDAVIGKLGNTINKEVDTMTATKEEIKGQVVSATTVNAAPKFKKRVKPEYTQEMLDNQVEGVIKVKILVDVDGKVKKVKVLNDLGHGSAKQAIKACWALEFSPALREGEPVAVWIIIPIRFVLLG